VNAKSKLGIGAGAGLVIVALLTRAGGSDAKVEAGVVGERIVAEARVVATDGIAHVTVPTDGRVLKVFVHEGDHVEAGAPLADLSPESDPTKMTSPIAGTILIRRLDPGDFVRVLVDGPVFEIGDPTRTEVRLEVQEADADRIAKGARVTITSVGGRETLGEATLVRIGERMEPRGLSADDARTSALGWARPAYAAWKDKAPALTIGRHVEAVVHGADLEVPARVPKAAVRVRDGRAVVRERFLLWSRDVPVELGRADDAFVEVKGIAAGRVVIVDR
jgi:pyruvate/2-oxoglutarate dehydrogenase complex dihydrolipoamide acyltransferase (E2) component